MRGQRDPRPYLQDILDSIQRLRRYTSGMDLVAFCKDEVIQDAVVRRIEVMGEAVTNLHDDLKDKHPEVPWQDIGACGTS